LFAVFADKKQPKHVGKMPQKFNSEVMTTFLKKNSAKWHKD